MQSHRTIAATSCRRVHFFRIGTWQYFLIVFFLPLCAWAQTPNKAETGANITLNTDVAIKLQPAADLLSSGTLRVGDYVKFVVVENVFALDENGDRRVVIAKDAVAFGKVIERHHKFTIFKKGAFRVKLESLRAVDGQEIKYLRIIRPNNYPPCPKESVRTYPETPTSNPQRTEPNCISGRVYSGTFFANLPSAIITAGATAALVLVNDPTAKAAAAITLVQQISSEPGLGKLVNGADAVITKDEYFDAYLTEPVTIKVPPPKE